MRSAAILTTLVLSTTPVFASGGLWCTADDAKVKFEVESGITRGLGNPLFNFRGELEILDKAVADDLRKTKFDINNLTQHWLDADELKMVLYWERTSEMPFGLVDLLIETKSVDEATYEGKYTLTVSDMNGDTTGEGKTFTFDGKASCGAE